jgi:hypothetical protein
VLATATPPVSPTDKDKPAVANEAITATKDKTINFFITFSFLLFLSN